MGCLFHICWENTNSISHWQACALHNTIITECKYWKWFTGSILHCCQLLFSLLLTDSLLLTHQPGVILQQSMSWGLKTCLLLHPLLILNDEHVLPRIHLKCHPSWWWHSKYFSMLWTMCYLRAILWRLTFPTNKIIFVLTFIKHYVSSYVFIN